jgi:hypothetical protein
MTRLIAEEHEAMNGHEQLERAGDLGGQLAVGGGDVEPDNLSRRGRASLLTDLTVTLNHLQQTSQPQGVMGTTLAPVLSASTAAARSAVEGTGRTAVRPRPGRRLASARICCCASSRSCSDTHCTAQGVTRIVGRVQDSVRDSQSKGC